MPSFEPPSPNRKRRLKRLRRLRSRQGRPRFRGHSFNRLIPNILTMIGLCAGLSAMRFGLDGHFGRSAVALLFAACIDAVDGRIARLLRATSVFGAEFDSLSDFLCFGVAPSFILYLWSLHDGGRYGFLPCILFTVCMALRLARFNSAIAGPSEQPIYAYNFFTGVPAPAGAGLALFPLFVGLEANKLQWTGLFTAVNHPAFVGVMLIGVAFLLVSTLPVWSFKNFKVPAEFVLPMLLGVSGFAAVLVADPWAALAGVGMIYLVMLPFSRRSFRRLKADAEALQEDVPDEPAQEPGVAQPRVA